MKKEYLSWEDIAKLSHSLADKIAADCPNLSQVTLIAISRGGLVPTQLIAYQLDIRDVRIIKLMSYDENNQRCEISDISTDKLCDGKNVYIIDDLADSGATIQYLRKQYPLAKLCTLLQKTCCTTPPDICIKQNIDAQSWIVFPWD